MMIVIYRLGEAIIYIILSKDRQRLCIRSHRGRTYSQEAFSGTKGERAGGEVRKARRHLASCGIVPKPMHDENRRRHAPGGGGGDRVNLLCGHGRSKELDAIIW